MENGDMVKTKRLANISGDAIWAGGGGATVEIRDWDNNLKWSYSINDSLRRLHHDIAVTDEGNILMIVWELKNTQECLAAGRDTALNDQDELWPDYIIEVDPTTDEIVWEWHVWDHLIQDQFPLADNFGVVANSPSRVDVNFPIDRTHPDWMHSNSLDYLPSMNIICLSVPYFSEIWYIDHSTTAAQAATGDGGAFNLGGDLIYRWGNPAAYQAGDSTDQRLFFEHDAHWIDDYLPNDHPLAGRMAVFNNRAGADFSSAVVIEPLLDYQGMTFLMNGGKWLPQDPLVTYTHPTPAKMYSTGLSSVQHLPNGNVLLCSGGAGYSFELTPTDEIVWEYKTPLLGGQPVSQGTVLDDRTNNTFRMTRIPSDYVAFDGRDLTPQGYLELDPNLNFCDSLVSTMGPIVDYKLKLYPNPTSDQLVIEWESADMVDIDVYDALGRPVTQVESQGGRTYVNTSDWQAGFYFVMINGVTTKVVLIE
jgi:hypothetical protein